MNKNIIGFVAIFLSACSAFAETQIVDGLTWTYTVSNGVASVGGKQLSEYFWIPAVPQSTRGAITIPSTLGNCPVTSIGRHAFDSCSGLTSVVIPDGVTCIGGEAFNGCSGLTSITIPDGVTSIGDGVFNGCSGLLSVTIPNGITSIGDFAFCVCSGLTSITIPDSVTVIGVSAFNDCSGLTSLAIPDSVTSIGAAAFYCCSGLTSITIPRHVESLGDNAFSGCSNLRRIILSEKLVTSLYSSNIPWDCEFVNIESVAFLSVQSDFGTPRPDGTIACETNSIQYCSVNGSPYSGNIGIRRVCTGWTGTGSVPASGTATNVTFAITEDSTLAWNWRKENRIAVSVTGDGACAFGTQWVEDETVVMAEIVPPRHFHAIALSGDTNGVTLAGTELSIPSDRPRCIFVDVTDLTGLIETGTAVSWSEVEADAGWRIAPDETADDGYSLRSEEMGAAQTAAIEAIVEGAGAVSFDWRISSARGHYAKFHLDGVETNSITRLTQWATVSHSLGDGRHVLRWTYKKGTGATAGEDAAFLDNVRWEPLALEGALDATNLVWTTDGDAPWTPQITVSSDGVDAAKSGAVFGEATSRLSTVVTNAGTLEWKWKADVAGSAGVEVYLDGEDLYDAGIYLEGTSDWADASLEIMDAGEHVVTFEYWNGGTAATISDSAYIDCVSWTPAKPASVVVEGVEIPSAWLATNAPAALAAAGEDYEAAAEATAANGVNKVWECYVAGLSPTNAAARFEARIDMVGGEPVVTWDPDLGVARDYVVEGKTNLVDRSWGPTNESTRFFRVKVELP